MFNKLKQFKDLKSQANQFKEILAKEEVEGEAAFGKIKILMNGNNEVLEVKIDPELLTQGDSLEMALVEAYNDGHEKVKKIMIEKVKEYGLPGGMGM